MGLSQKISAPGFSVRRDWMLMFWWVGSPRRRQGPDELCDQHFHAAGRIRPTGGSRRVTASRAVRRLAGGARSTPLRRRRAAALQLIDFGVEAWARWPAGRPPLSPVRQRRLTRRNRRRPRPAPRLLPGPWVRPAGGRPPRRRGPVGQAGGGRRQTAWTERPVGL